MAAAKNNGSAARGPSNGHTLALTAAQGMAGTIEKVTSDGQTPSSQRSYDLFITMTPILPLDNVQRIFPNHP